MDFFGVSGPLYIRVLSVALCRRCMVKRAEGTTGGVRWCGHWCGLGVLSTLLSQQRPGM